MRNRLSVSTLVALVVLAMGATPAAAERGLLLSWGSLGRAPGQFGGTLDLATDAAGDVYVLDRENSRVQRFSPDGSLLKVWGTLGNDPGQLRNPWDVAVTDAGDVYVMDGWDPRIQVFGRDGTLLRWWPLGNSGPIAVARSGSFVAFGSGWRVSTMTPSGDPLNQWGTFGASPGQLNNIVDLAVGPDGNIYVLDGATPRVAVFKPNGTFVREFTGLHTGLNLRPTAIAVDASGEVLVMHAGVEGTIQSFTRVGGPAGPDLTRCTTPGTASGLAVGPGGAVYGAFGPRIDKFGPGGADTWVATCNPLPGPPATPPSGHPPIVDPPSVPAPQPEGPRPPAGRTGVSVNSGALYTNRPEVTLNIVWPRGTRTVLVSNDGGFGRAREFPVRPAMPWRLDSSGPERLPKTVYVRFGSSNQTFTDDIILDETAPRVVSARLVAPGAGSASAATRQRLYRLRLRAYDRTSGVASVQVAVTKRRPLRMQRFHKVIRVRSAKVPRFVRVRDRAGNLSRWRRIAHRRASAR